ncbi:MAG TPA: T9SS type A sorting domain-containing protein [Flavipsychrobacter sp.]|nr:T9SS type A sorting domain-containing protein [Flavipsychrobacter sp.]
MKKIFTFFISCLFALLCSSDRSTGQNFFSESFDSLGATFPYHNWTSNVVTSYCCLSNYDWHIIGSGGGYINYVSSVGTDCYPWPPSHSGLAVVTYNSWETEAPCCSYPATTPVETDLISPGAVIPTSGKTVLSFWVYIAKPYASFSSAYRYDSLEVYVSSSTSITSSSTKLYQIGVDSSTSITNGWYQYVDTLPSSISGKNYIIFKGANYYYTDGADINLDDISLDTYHDCTGDPISGTLNAPSGICSGNSFSITDTTLSHNLGITYVWQSTPTGTSSWSTISGATASTYQSFGIYSATDYRVIATCAGSGETDTSNVSTVNINPFYYCYCNTGLYYSSYSPPPTIDSVAISSTTLKHATHKQLPAPNFYALISPDSPSKTATLTKGGVYTLYASYGGGYTGSGMAWIDYNHNGSFDGYGTPNEFLNLNACCSGAYYGSTSFQVPVDADTGLTGLRIRNAQYYYSYSYYACDMIYAGGETEDYVVNIQPAPGHDLACVAILNPAPDTTACANTNIGITAVIYNMGANPDSNFNVYATYSGPETGSIYIGHPAALQPYTFDTLYLGTIAPPLGGTYKVNVYPVLATDSNHINDTSSINIHLNPTPNDPTAVSDTVCNGNAATVSIIPQPKASYNWYNVDTGGVVAFSGSSITFPSLTSDTTLYISGIFASTGCTSNRVPVHAAIGTAPIVNLGTGGTVCESPSLNLDAGNPGATYLWNTGATTEKIHINTSGTYIVNVFKYCAATGSVTYTVNPLPSSDGINYDRMSNTYYFSAVNVQNDTGYLWIFGDGTTSTLTDPMHTYPSDSPYHVLLVLSNACGNDTVRWGVPTSVAGINQNDQVIKLYPNPANTSITIAGDNDMQFQDIAIMNSAGATVYRNTNNSFKSENINISNLPAGVYILKANTDKGHFNKLFEVLHN